MRRRPHSSGSRALAPAVVAAGALLAAVVRAAWAQSSAAPAGAVTHPAVSNKPPEKAAPGSCVQCHAAVTKHLVVHPKAEDCASCHVQETDSAHRFALERCTKCHQVVTTADKFVHGPVAVGDCLPCHAPHGTDEPQLLRAFGAGLCETCHVEMKAKLAEKRFTHAPLKEDCATCHNPHASPLKYQLRDDSANQCFVCHKTMPKALASARVQHDALTVERQCLNCHDPHAADFGSQLRAPSMELCLQCHDRELQTPSGNLQNIKAWLQTHTNLHGPIRQQDCVGCHRPHEAAHFRLLRRDYPATFYSPFDQKKYELCFMCHQPDLAQVERTTTLTAFRNGDHNLHFVHVNRGDKGRTCRACHDAHSSSSPKHLRETVPFGAWQLPVRYEEFADGGRCAPGCHVPMQYGRTTPLVTTALNDRR